MLRVGLTGGIASGKSTVAAMLRDRGYPVLDADLLARELLKPGRDAYNEVIREFGRAILLTDGAVNRAKLGSIVFADSGKRAKLNDILHPRIRHMVAEWFSALDRTGGPNVAFENAALILEAGSRDNLDRIIVCWCRPEQQIQRLRDRDMSLEEAQRRIAAQMPMDEKRRLADDVIDCSGTLQKTEGQVEQVLKKLEQLAGSKRGSI